MNKAHLLTSLMVVRSLDVKKDPFHPCEKGEELLGLDITPQKYPKIFIIILLYIPGMN